MEACQFGLSLVSLIIITKRALLVTDIHFKELEGYRHGPSEKSDRRVPTMTLPLSLEWDKDEHFGRGASASDGAISRQAIPVQRTSELAAAASIPFKINFSIQIPFRRPRSQTSLVKLLYSKVISYLI